MLRTEDEGELRLNWRFGTQCTFPSALCCMPSAWRNGVPQSIPKPLRELRGSMAASQESACHQDFPGLPCSPCLKDDTAAREEAGTYSRVTALPLGHPGGLVTGLWGRSWPTAA